MPLEVRVRLGDIRTEMRLSNPLQSVRSALETTLFQRWPVLRLSNPWRPVVAPIRNVASGLRIGSVRAWWPIFRRGSSSLRRMDVRRHFGTNASPINIATLLLSAAIVPTAVADAETWCGLVVEPERRCSAYDSDEYSHPASVEPAIVEQQGGVFSPYTLRRFDSIRETDIEHIVAKVEAHDSGLCERSNHARRAFARDPLNLTLASPDVNRRLKRAYDPAEWLPEENRCWYVQRWVLVKRKWRLSVDAAERESLSAVIEECRRASGKMRKPRFALQRRGTPQAIR